MESNLENIEVRAIDRWNGRLLLAIIFGYAFFHLFGGFIAQDLASKPGTLGVQQLLVYGVIVVSGMMTFAITLGAFGKVMYPFMAWQRVMIDEVWKLIKKVWELR